MQSLPFAPGSADSEDGNLGIPSRLRIREPVDSKIAEVGCQHIRTARDAIAGNDQHQNAAWPQPAKAMLQKHPLHPLVAPLGDLIVIRRIQVQQRVRLDRAMSIEDASLDNFVKDTACLHCPKAVQFDSVSTSLRLASDLPQRRARPGTGIEHRALRREFEETTKPLSFARNERIVTQFQSRCISRHKLATSWCLAACDLKHNFAVWQVMVYLGAITAQARVYWGFYLGNPRACRASRTAQVMVFHSLQHPAGRRSTILLTDG